MGERPGRVNWQVEPTGPGSEAYVVSVRDGERSRIPPGTESTAALRAEIRQTRAEMAGTIDAIQDRLDPERLMEQAKDQAKEVIDHARDQARETIHEAAGQAKEVVHEAAGQAKEAVREATGQARHAVREATIGRAEQMANYANETARDAGSSMWGTIRANPLPAALAGIGLGWLWMKRRSAARPALRGDDSLRYRGAARWDDRWAGNRERAGLGTETAGAFDRAGERVGDTIDRTRDQLGETAGQLRDQAGATVDAVGNRIGAAAEQAGEVAGDLVDRAQDGFDRFTSRVQEGAEQVPNSLERLVHDYPLAVGAAAVGLGAAIGLALPTTPSEGRIFGEARDSLVGQAQAALGETQRRVQRVVEETGRSIEVETSGDAYLHG